LKKKPRQGRAKLRHVLFLLKPCWKYGKGYLVVTLLMAAVFQPLSAYLSALLPQKAIDAVMAGAQRRDILLTIGMYTLGIALLTAADKIAETAYARIAQMKLRACIQPQDMV
jgi:hypothetical protein